MGDTSLGGVYIYVGGAFNPPMFPARDAYNCHRSGRPYPPSDLPPLNVATFRKRIYGGANQGRARDATRKEAHSGADHWEAPRG